MTQRIEINLIVRNKVSPMTDRSFAKEKEKKKEENKKERKKE